MDLSFVFPCLNEEHTIGDCIREVQNSLAAADIESEIVVADNGSTDRSCQIAESLGARVVPVARKGYGAALRGGIEAAKGRYAVFADADGTYLLKDTAKLYEKAVSENADMVVASRITGEIEPGAMPFLHRYLGTPVLTALINLLFNGSLSDCNSGFRCLRKESYEKWDIRSDGMEFASELLIKALKAKSRIVEIRSGLRKDRPGRVAHLRTWRDGMRHLLFIFSECPQLFERLGLFLMLVPTLLQVVAVFTGPLKLAGLNIFDLHSQTLLLLTALTGTQLYLFSCFIYLVGDASPSGPTRRLLSLDEGVLFFALLAFFLAESAVIGTVVWQWATARFGGIYIVDMLISLTHFLSVPLMLTIGLLGLHIFKKSKGE